MTKSSSSPQHHNKEDFWKILLLFICICIVSAILANCTTKRQLPAMSSYRASSIAITNTSI
ncbi:MAG: hypothetical protein HFI72_04835 [Peptococcaceae bacterium]|nr:hypothetical protein [Peptococcaceae bacterium]